METRENTGLAVSLVTQDTLAVMKPHTVLVRLVNKKLYIQFLRCVVSNIQTNKEEGRGGGRFLGPKF